MKKYRKELIAETLGSDKSRERKESNLANPSTAHNRDAELLLDALPENNRPGYIIGTHAGAQSESNQTANLVGMLARLVAD